MKVALLGLDSLGRVGSGPVGARVSVLSVSYRCLRPASASPLRGHYGLIVCGIAGTYQQGNGESAARVMSKTLADRGPDDEGLYSFADDRGHVHLAHRRLSIIDLATGQQPLSKQGLTLCYNGELYNYRELRRVLTGLGVSFTTSSDTEVVLESWRRWGPDCLLEVQGHVRLCPVRPGERIAVPGTRPPRNQAVALHHGEAMAWSSPPRSRRS